MDEQEQPNERKRTPQSMARRPTKEEMQTKIEFVRDCIRAGMPKSKLKELFRAKFGPSKNDPTCPVPSAGTIEDYIKRAKDAIAGEIGAGKEAMRNYLGEFFEGVIAKTTNKMSDRLRAAENFAQLHGLNAPTETKSVMSGPGDGPIQVVSGNVDLSKLTDEELDSLLNANAILRRNQYTIGAGPEASIGEGETESFGVCDSGESGEIHFPGPSQNGQPKPFEPEPEED